MKRIFTKRKMAGVVRVLVVESCHQMIVTVNNPRGKTGLQYFLPGLSPSPSSPSSVQLSGPELVAYTSVTSKIIA